MPDLLTDFDNNLSQSKNILLLIPGTPSGDVAAAALAFYICLKQAKKQVAIACPQPINVSLNHLIGVDKITSQIGSRNLMISFDYIEDSIDKVSYHIENDKFNLVIAPKDGFPPLDSTKISYSYSGAAADLIIIIGAQRLESLGKIYQDEQKIFIDNQTVNIDVNPTNARFGKINLLDPAGSSCSELIGLIIKNLNLSVNPDVTTNIIAGIEQATDNFTFKTRAETFEVVAWCLKNGGRQGQLRTQTGGQTFDTRQFMAPGAGKQQPARPISGQPTPQRFTPSQNFGAAATNVVPQKTSEFSHPTPMPRKGQNFNSNQQPRPLAVPSPDWLRPKIYKSSSQV